jgi:PAS domain S-box-containing protein
MLDRSQIIQMVHPDDRERAIAGQMELSNLPVGKVIEGEYRWIKFDGSICWLHMYQTAISRSPKDGSTLQSLTIVQDITDVVRTSMELSQSEEDFRNLVDNIPGAVYRATYSNKFSTLYLSDYFTKMTSMDKNLIIEGKISWLDMIHPDDRQKMIAGVKKAAQNRTPFEFEYRVKRSGGDYFWMEDTGRITYDDDGKPIYVNGIMTDITTRKQNYEAMSQLSQDNLRLLAQARRDSETKTLLLNEVNHRVKNNMASIIGLLEMESIREIKSAPDYQSALTDLRNRISGLATVHDILSSNQWSPVQLELFTRKIIENAASSSPLGRKVTIDIISQDKNLWINSRQATALALIINELTTNSVRHAFPLKEKGTITVTIRKEEKNSNRVRLIFADDGPGWPQDIIDGTGGNVGMQVMKLSVASPLNGEIKFENHNGAVAIVTFNLAPQRDTVNIAG